MMLVSKRELSDVLGLSERHLDRLVKAGVLPPRTAKGCTLKAAIRGYVAFLKSKAGGVAAERARLLAAQASLAELKLRQHTNELVLRDAVEHMQFTQYRQVRDGLQTIPSRVSGIVAAEQDQAVVFATLTREITLALEGLAAHGRQGNKISDSYAERRLVAGGRGADARADARRPRRHRGPD